MICHELLHWSEEFPMLAQLALPGAVLTGLQAELSHPLCLPPHESVLLLLT